LTYHTKAEEVELVDKEENYACHVKEMLYDDILGEYKKAAIKYWR